MPVSVDGADKFDAERVCAYVADALAALDPELVVPVEIVENEATGRRYAWASRYGVFVRRSALDDGELRWTVVEEVAHY